ncbi:hypothetical protein JXB27_02930 [Candidatus Woesearchaeota archaeon]|nr:hypothetical protein [Candidatus Woesearchaeota archaeon]
MITANDVIEFVPSVRAINDAINCAIQKAHFVKSYGPERSLVRKMDDIYRGDLAREAIIDWLRTNVTPAVYYNSDEIRGSLTTPDNGFDIWHDVLNTDGESQNVHFIEVKSRLIPRAKGAQVSLEDAVKNLNMTIPAEDFKKNPIVLEKHPSDVLMQVLFDNNKLATEINDKEVEMLFGLKQAKARGERFADLFEIHKRHPRLFLAGWIPTRIVAKYSKTISPNTCEYFGRKHYIFPLQNALPLKTYTND